MLIVIFFVTTRRVGEGRRRGDERGVGEKKGGREEGVNEEDTTFIANNKGHCFFEDLGGGKEG